MTISEAINEIYGTIEGHKLHHEMAKLKGNPDLIAFYADLVETWQGVLDAVRTATTSGVDNQS